MNWYSAFAVCAGVLTLIFGASVFACYLIDYFRIAAAASGMRSRDDLAKKLVSPDFTGAEEYYGIHLIDPLRSHYLDNSEMLQSDFSVPLPDGREMYIAHYHPLDIETIIGMREAYGIPRDLLPIASDGGDVEYFVNPSDVDYRLIEFDTDRGEMVPLVSFSEFCRARGTKRKDGRGEDR